MYKRMHKLACLMAICATTLFISSDAFWLYSSRRHQHQQQRPKWTNNNNNYTTTANNDEISPARTTQSPGHDRLLATSEAPIELQFELSAEEPESDDSGGARIARTQTFANGSAILEDLVNQFLARGREQQQQKVRASREHEHEFTENATTSNSSLVSLHSLQLVDGDSNNNNINQATISQHVDSLAPANADDQADKLIHYDILANGSSSQQQQTPTMSAKKVLEGDTSLGDGQIRPAASLSGAGIVVHPTPGKAANVTRASSEQHHQARAIAASGGRQPARSNAQSGAQAVKPPYAYTDQETEGKQSDQLQSRADTAVSTDTTHAEAGEKEPQQQQQRPSGTEQIGTSTMAPKPAEPQQQQQLANEIEQQRQQLSRQRDELDKVASKYAPANDIHELSPTISTTNQHTTNDKRFRPSSLAAWPPAVVDDNPNSNSLTERFFVSSQGARPFAGSFEQRDPNAQQQATTTFELGALPPISEPANHFEPDISVGGQQPATSSTARPHDFSSAAPDSSQLVSSLLGSSALDHLINKKTLETVSNQIQSSDTNSLKLGHQQAQQLARAPPDLHIHQQRVTTTQRSSIGRPAPASNVVPHVASLVNVTAPMILPLSASEAMEAEQQQLHLAPQEHGSGSRAYKPAGYFVPPPPTSLQQPVVSQQHHQTSYSRPINTLANLGQLPRPGMLVAHHHHHQPGTSELDGPTTVRPRPHHHSGSIAGHWIQNHAASLAMPTGYSSSQQLESMQQRQPSSLSAITGANNSNFTNNNYNASQQQYSNILATTSTPAPSTTPGSTSTTALDSTSNGFLTNSNSTASTPAFVDPLTLSTVVGQQQQQNAQTSAINRRAFNLTRVEHISAECSNDLIRTVIIFNGTFKGLIYSSGFVHDPNCLYINGTGKTRYDFSIRLNQCGTTGRQELHAANGPNDIRRRDQVMWNALSIQYNPLIEQEWDEHFRVSCEYGSDFWKTISFNPFNVETNTGSPVVFTVEPPQCQMEILRGHGTVGPRQEAVSSPVTVGDPLTLLVHMKSEKAGYDIIIKNCIAHNGGKQKMQLIDSNGCVVNERFISPFRGMYNDKDLKQITLYAYMKAFRFTGSSALYVECEVHMCQSACPPQMCYWRRLS